MGRGKPKKPRHSRKERRHAQNLQTPVLDFPPLPPRTSPSSTAPWGPWRGPAKNNHLAISVYERFSPSDQAQYRRSFAANKADRKEMRLEKKLAKVENEQIDRGSAGQPIFATSTSNNGVGTMNNMHTPPNIKENIKPISLNHESTDQPSIKPELDEDDDENPDSTTKNMTDAQYLAEFRHNESDMHLRALLWKRHTGLYHMPAKVPA